MNVLNVLIADDEQLVLEGLKQIIDWEANGFSICGTAANGQDTLDKILAMKPDLVLLDIRMPRMTGIEVVKAAQESGFTGKFIILSGLSDFKLAQTAMRYGVDFYLTKPIDEDELEQSISAVHNLIEDEKKASVSYSRYRDKARKHILKEILLNTCDYHTLDLSDLHLDAHIYQVITYGNYNQDTLHPAWNFSELMRVTNQDSHTYDILEIEKRKIILLKGDFAISRFQNMLEHYHTTPQKGSPFDAVFLAYGRQVFRIEDIHLSYQDVCQLEGRRFFCARNQHVIGCEELHIHLTSRHLFTQDLAPKYAESFSNYIQSHNPTLISDTLNDLSDYLTRCTAEISDLKHFLIDIYILVKQKIMQIFPQADLPFLANASIIILIEEKYYLYEIIEFLKEQFEMWMHSVGYSSGENVLDEVLHYIQYNYQENLKLETLAPLFGYNSSYLGRLFTKKLNVNFNSYLDQVRIAKAKELLDDGSLKVYEIAERVGYSNVDYFHRKFKKYEGTSPAEYRKKRG
nr:response regulator [uncultured Schaedlerella sp.]